MEDGGLQDSPAAHFFRSSGVPMKGTSVSAALHCQRDERQRKKQTALCKRSER